ncbi:ATP-binding protein [Flavobacterium sp. MXW15]|uniref:ATP-binding protein n=1 Tax=Xanthomonas chitinilytica TaxID=2989819 RepID=A0ABT3JWF5_9XANT|nr:ATP-binding protein [Xanthomonas sp. H13-6]MCW4454808.1 ATP-binding protein [Flavobacterium sp. MXW15]MCW4472564.1 ATP-binding protein [Xanthomonas sp. H13-6]
MLTDELLEQLRYKGEGSDLDYKAERPAFIKAGDDDKSELLKDILAMSNAHRDGTAYILFGFKENVPHPAEVVGLPAEGAIDDSRLQQFVNEKLEAKLHFRYEERLFDGKHVAVLSIPKQPRPFYLAKPYGKLAKETVYVRRGSATGIASLREVAMMGAANAERPIPKLELLLLDQEGRPLASQLDRVFYHFPGDIPDYESDPGPLYQIRYDNHDFYRDGAEYRSAMGRFVGVSLILANRSDFSLSNAKLEVRVEAPDGAIIEMMRFDDLPDEPEISGIRSYIGRSVVERLQERVHIEGRGGQPVGHVLLGTIRPGEEARCEQDLALLPSMPGTYELCVRILASEVGSPIEWRHTLAIDGPVEVLDLDGLQALLFQDIIDKLNEG